MKHPTKQIEQIIASIKEFGFNQPLVVDKNDVLVVGHGRYLAAQALELKTVPVLKLDVTEEQAKAYRLADNKLNESNWDMQLVIQELRELSIPMLDLTGFGRDLVLNNDHKDDQVPATPNVPISKLGDFYEFGNHKIICGDSTNSDVYKKLLGWNENRKMKADMVFTDPPYNVDYHGDGKQTQEGIQGDKMAEAAFDVFLSKFFGGSVEFVKSGAGWYIFHSSSTQHQFRRALTEAGLEVRVQLIWNKPTASMGWGDYRWKHEPFFYAGKKGDKLAFYGDRTKTTVVDFHKSDAEILKWVNAQREAEKAGKMTIWTMKREPVQEYVHPTQKPVELITYALANSSKIDDVVLDPFLGSGSTIIACQKTNRICYGVEIDPKFMDVIIQRWVDYTGNKEIKKNGEQITW